MRLLLLPFNLHTDENRRLGERYEWYSDLPALRYRLHNRQGLGLSDYKGVFDKNAKPLVLDWTDSMFWNKNNQPGWYSSKLNDYKAVLLSGDFSSIPWVFCVLSEKHNASKTAAADILCDALGKMSFDDLVRIDKQMRQTTSMEWSIDWRKLSIDSFFTSEMSKDKSGLNDDWC